MHTRFATAFTRMSPRNPAHRPYVVRFGETLADVAQRFRTTESALRTLNALEDEARVIAGFDLMVPAVEPEDPPAEERPVVAVPDETTHPGLRRVFYRVTDEDTAPSIARFFGVSVDDLRRWNHVDPHASFQRGMVLQLFVAPDRDLSRAVVLAENEVRILVVGTEEFHDWHEAQQGRVRFRYTVQPGDTLTSIAQRFELSVGSVGRINRFARDTVLRAGQEILVYAPRDRVAANVRREYDERLAAQATARGEAPPEPRPAVADDGDGDDAASEHGEPSIPAATEPVSSPAPTPEAQAPGG
jgi:membrane-bound lytic murein transglycosylase D